MFDFYSRSIRVKGIRVMYQYFISNSINRDFWGKCIYCYQCCIFGWGLIDCFQVVGGGFVVFSGYVFQVVMYYMDNVQLDMDLWEDVVYCIWEVFQIIYIGNQDVLNVLGFQFCQYVQLEFFVFIFGQLYIQ